MTRQEALTVMQCNVTQLSKLLGISTQAISQWKKEKIPLVREYQIRELLSQKQIKSS